MIIKLITNVVLIPIKGIYEKGAIIGNILCHFVSFIIVYNALRKNMVLNFTIKELILKPIIINIIMIAISYGLFTYMKYLGFYEYISTIVGIISAIVIYIILIILFNIFSKEETIMLPNGEKINKILKKM